MNNLKSIIFDFGGVLLNIDPDLTLKAFDQLGVRRFDKVFFQEAEAFNKFEVGKIDEEEFCDEIRSLSLRDLSNDEIIKCWNALLLDLLERLFLLEKLSTHFSLFLLSNTNLIHYKSYIKYIDEKYSLARFNKIFKRTYYSHEIGMRKPNTDIFEMVLEENLLVPQETLFIDDTAENVEGAKKTGMKSILLEKNKTITDLFKDSILSPELAQSLLH